MTTEELAKALLRLGTIADNVQWFYLEAEIMDAYDRSSSPEEFRKNLESVMQDWENDLALVPRWYSRLLVKITNIVSLKTLGIYNKQTDSA